MRWRVCAKTCRAARRPKLRYPAHRPWVTSGGYQVSRPCLGVCSPGLSQSKPQTPRAERRIDRRSVVTCSCASPHAHGATGLAESPAFRAPLRRSACRRSEKGPRFGRFRRARASKQQGRRSFARVQRLAPPRPPTHSPARLQARPLRRTHEARSLWPGGPREARHHRFRRQNPRSVAHRHRHRRRHARLRRTGRYQEGQYQPAEGGAGQAAARRLHRQCAQLHRDRVELFGSRRRGRHADPERADHLQQGADLDLRAERQHHHPEGIR